MPHHPVIGPEKLTTRMRIVFDTSSKSGGEKSLNECLYPGPPLTAELFGILLRFRVFNVTAVGDTEKAFLQLILNSDDRDYVRLFWFSDVHKINFFEILKVTSLWSISFVSFVRHYHIPYHSVLPIRSKICCSIVKLIAC